MLESGMKVSGGMHPDSFTSSKIDYQSLIFRQSDRICYLLANALNTTDVDREGGAEFNVKAAIYAVAQSIHAFECLLMPKMVSSNIIQGYLCEKREILTSRWQEIENDAMAGSFLDAAQRCYVNLLLRWYGLLMLQVHLCGLVRGEARKLQSGAD